MSTWTDFHGVTRPILSTRRALRFHLPSHAALRQFVFRRDNYTCQACGVRAAEIPNGYDGTKTLFTDSSIEGGWPPYLVVDHVLTRRAGGTSSPANLQTLCEYCNRRKLAVDLRAARDA